MTKHSRSQAPKRMKSLAIILVLVSIVLLALSNPIFRSFNGEREDDIDTFHSHEHLTHAPPKKPSNPKRRPSRILNRKGVLEFVTTIRDDWRVAIASFLDGVPVDLFSKDEIQRHFDENINNIKETTVLVEILNGNINFTEEYQGKHGRASSVKYMLSKIVNEKKKSLPGVTFLVIVNDGYKPNVASFGSARHWNSWEGLIPVPLGNTRGVREGWGTPLEGWDDYVDRNIWTTHYNYSWESKVPKALFRGSLFMQTHKLGSCNSDGGCKKASKWDEVNRGVLYTVAQKRPDILDVAFTSFKEKSELGDDQFDEAPEAVEKMLFKDFQNFKYLINVGSNQDWAERLRTLLYTNSAVIMHEADTKEFFTPLLQPWVHYIPTNLMFTDLAKNIEWAISHDEAVQQIVRNANAFADRYISERAMQQYWEVAIEEFAKLQASAATQGKDDSSQ